MFSLSRMLARREIDAWRDRWADTAYATLADATAGIIDSLEGDLATVSWRRTMLAPNAYMTTVTDPHVRSVVDPLIEKLVRNANSELLAIVEHQAVWHASPRADEPDVAGDGLAHVASAVAPLAAAGGLAIALPGMAVTTTTAWLGMVTVTTISWPVAIGIGTVAGTLFLLGGYKLAGVPDKLRARLAKRMRARVEHTLLRGTAEHPSILHQLVTILETTADQAKRARFA